LLLAHWLPKLSIGEASPTASFLAPSKMAHISFDTSILPSPYDNAVTANLKTEAFHAHVKQVFTFVEAANPWLLSEQLVCKPDQLIKRRGKNGLLGINLSWSAVKEWIAARAGKVIKVTNKSPSFRYSSLSE
jgi:ATP citrate (pro-S)-lyase